MRVMRTVALYMCASLAVLFVVAGAANASAAAPFTKSWGYGVSTGAGQLETCTTSCREGVSGGGGDGALWYPMGAAVSPTTGNVFVTNGLARVEVYSSSGGFVRAFGGGVAGGRPEVCTTSCFFGSGGPGPASSPSRGASPSMRRATSLSATSPTTASPSSRRRERSSARSARVSSTGPAASRSTARGTSSSSTPATAASWSSRWPGPSSARSARTAREPGSWRARTGQAAARRDRHRPVGERDRQRRGEPPGRRVLTDRILHPSVRLRGQHRRGRAGGLHLELPGRHRRRRRRAAQVPRWSCGRRRWPPPCLRQPQWPHQRVHRDRELPAVLRQLWERRGRTRRRREARGGRRGQRDRRRHLQPSRRRVRLPVRDGRPADRPAWCSDRPHGDSRSLAGHAHMEPGLARRGLQHLRRRNARPAGRQPPAQHVGLRSRGASRAATRSPRSSRASSPNARQA